MNSLDHLGRVTTCTVDACGAVAAGSSDLSRVPVTLGQEIQVTGRQKYIVTVAGTTGALTRHRQRSVQLSLTVRLPSSPKVGI